MSINVTLLTKIRLEEVMKAAGAADVHVVCLQETRHIDGGFPWASRLARKAGWHVQWSSASACDNLGRRRCGGTALFWRPALGKGTAMQSQSDRVCGRAWAHCLVVSMYGNAQQADLKWMLDSVRAAESIHVPLRVLVGDYNWRPCYDTAVAGGWALVHTVPTTHSGPAAPTRCLLHGQREAQVDVTPVVGVPHHCAVVYAVPCQALATTPAAHVSMRLRRCAGYRWHHPPTTEVQQQFLHQAVDAVECGHDLESRWRAWHAKAEAVCQAAVALELAVLETKPERRKGSTPSARATAPGAAHRPQEGIAMRRFRRLHRAAAEQWRRGGPNRALTDVQQQHWRAVVRDAVAPAVRHLPAMQGEAVELASKAISELAHLEQRALATDWRRRFASWSQDAVAAAGPALRPAQPPANFTAADMREEWVQWWAPAAAMPGGRADSWRALAREAGCKQEAQKPWDPTSLERFCGALRATHGAAGLDGWSHEELKALAEHAPWVFVDLYALLVDTTSAAEEGLPEYVHQLLYSWRVVGIPKHGSDDSRPIAVGSCIIRAWHRALLEQLLGMPEGQWCGRQGSGVVEATANWLASPGDAGAELDLAKAFDTIDPSVAAAALEFFGTPIEVVALLRAAWSGPRCCNVDGELADPISPSMGLPPGDPASPTTLGSVLAPWNGLVERVAPRVKTWAFMDDRSLKVKDVEEDAGQKQNGSQQQALQENPLDKALEVTARFDAAIGLRENAKKRQVWQGSGAVEHLGLRLQGNPAARPLEMPKPRDGWSPTEELVKRLVLLPGPTEVRERLAGIFVLPRFRWAAPLIESPPASMARLLHKAILASACTWWCQGRWWCELHPDLGTALAALGAAHRTAGSPSAMLSLCLRVHAKALGLSIVSFDAMQGLWVRPCHGSDPRSRAAARAAHAAMEAPSGLPLDAFRPDRPAGAHAARICARVAVLATVHRTRFDSEGVDTIDLEAQSAQAWKRWLRSLTPKQRSQLSIWRGGAVRTPMRRWSRPGVADPRQRCAHCNCELASARHYWAECPRFDAARGAMEREYRIPPAWWAAQPRCTSKTGWITTAAGRTARRRAELQVAACRMGLAVVQANGELLEASL